jgi:hypothetical protein
MEKKILSEIDLYFGTINMPKGFEIDRSKLKADILLSQIENKTLSCNDKEYTFFDYEVSFSKPLDMLHTYLRERFFLKHNRTLLVKSNFGNILQHNEQSFSRKCLDKTNLNHSSDYILIYGVDVYPDSGNICIEYDNNRRVNKKWFIPIENNSFIMFPTTQRFFITKNNSHSTNVFLLSTLDYI